MKYASVDHQAVNQHHGDHEDHYDHNHHDTTTNNTNRRPPPNQDTTPPRVGFRGTSLPHIATHALVDTAAVVGETFTARRVGTLPKSIYSFRKKPIVTCCVSGRSLIISTSI